MGPILRDKEVQELSARKKSHNDAYLRKRGRQELPQIRLFI